MNRNPFQAYLDEIERLKNDLFDSRYTILNLMPEKIGNLLKGYYHVKSRQEGYAWEHEVVEQIITEANIFSKEEGSYLEDRAYCPLCGRGSNSPYDRGFAIPEGLRRHLTGWGNTSRCDVTEAAFRLARDHWHRSFHEKEEQEKKEKENILAERRKTETLFLVDLYSQPSLLEEGIYTYEGRVRNEEELLWAEQRLHGLGVKSSVEGNVKKYLDEREEYLVLADPRVNGKISFKVYRKPLIKKGKISARRPLYQSFYMQDAWKNDLLAKYTSRVTECIDSLRR